MLTVAPLILVLRLQKLCECLGVCLGNLLKSLFMKPDSYLSTNPCKGAGGESTACACSRACPWLDGVCLRSPPMNGQGSYDRVLWVKDDGASLPAK